jgi:diguanylate cyclase (GGDEF)-like protein
VKPALQRLAGALRSFTGRMVLASLVMHALLALSLGYGVHRIVSADLKDEFINTVRNQARQFALSIEANAGSRATVEGMLQDALLSGQIVEAELVLDDGTVLPRGPRLGKSAAAFLEDFAFDQHSDPAYRISIPIHSSTAELRGTLHLAFDKEPVQVRVRQLAQRGLFLIAAYLAFSLVLAVVSGRLLSRSIRRLRDAARRVAEGRTDEPLGIQTRIAEVASLAQDLELMRGELVRQGRALHALAYFDGLTSLANRTLFSERLTDALDLARRRSEKLAVLYVDLDRFKRVNDTLGHDAGDELLKNVGVRMQYCLQRGGDRAAMTAEMAAEAVARLGGDEFAILLPNIGTNGEAGSMADRLLDILNDPIRIGEHRVYATASVGIAIYPYDGQDAPTLLKNADTAMYHAKQKGKNGFQYYMGSMNVTAATRLEIESELHRAIELGQLVLYYQPQTDVQTGALTGAEALLRWQHPQRGLMTPDQFIHIAEESGLIVPIGEWVMRAACAQLRAWRQRGMQLSRVSVNVSARQFQHTGFLDTVGEALADFEIAPAMLDLEITETSLMSHEEDTMARLEGLRAIGVGLSIDDFGTGFSSLTYLRRFPVQALKIDQSFTKDIPENAHNAAIVRAIIALASSMRLNVIAEGVETRRHWQFLNENGCREMQGYLISRPIPVEAFEKFVQQMPLPGRPGRIYGIKT